MLLASRRLVSSKELIRAWTGRIIRGRYQQSALGWLWAFVQPIAAVLVFTVVFTRFVPVDTGNTPYIIFSYIAILPWNLLAMSLPEMTVSMVQNMNLVTKIYFPREVLPIAVLLARLFDFGISLILLVFLFLIYRIAFSPTSLIYMFFILIIQMALILGIGLISSALNVFYRDVDPILRLVIQVWFYASPIIYPVSMVPENLQKIYFLNPMAGIIVGYRDILLEGKMPGSYLIPAVVVSFLLLIFGYWIFRRLESQFADIV